MKTITKNIVTLIITLGVFSSPFFAHAATWVGPTATPPGNNVSAPVNVGGTYQIKAGDLGVISLFANYIKSLGVISAKSYCFNNGTASGRDQNCITSWPAGGTGGGIESIVAGTNVTVDNTDPLNPIVSSTATGGTSGVIVRKDGVPVVSPATTLNFTGSNITTTPSGNSVSIAVAPANPTALQKDGIQVSAAPLALNLTGNNITATNTNGIVSIAVAPATPIAVRKDGVQVSAGPIALDFIGSNITAVNSSGVIKISVAPATPATPTAIQKDGIQVSAAPLAINFRGNNITTLNTNGVVSVDVKNIGIQKNGVVVSNNPPTLNFTGNNITTTTNVDGTVNLDIKTKISAVNEGAVIGNDFHTIDVGAGGLIATNAGNGVLMLGFDSTALSNVLPSPSPADRTLRSDGTNWVQSTTVTNTTSGFFVRAINNPPVTLATPQSSFNNTEDIFQAINSANPLYGRGLGVRKDGTVRVQGLVTSITAPLPISTGLFLNSNDVFHVIGTFPDRNGPPVLKGFGLDVTGTTRVEGVLAVNGAQFLDGNFQHYGDKFQTGDTNQIGNYNLTGDLTHTGNGTHAGDNYFIGNLNVNGGTELVGTVDIAGNVVHTGNINTHGRWAVIDTVSSALPSVGLSGNGINTPPVEPYTFISKVTGFYNGSLGLTRSGSTVVDGDLQVYGPSTFTGNMTVSGSLSVGSTIKAGNLVNTSTPPTTRPVCAANDGTLYLCTLPNPTVEITSSGLTNNSFTSAPLVNTTGAITSSQNTNISYTTTNATSCSLTVPQGSAPSWISSHAVPNLFSNDFVKNTTINSTGATVLKVTCFGGGGTASDTITIYGHGSWKATSPGTYQLSFSNFTNASAQIWGGGAGGGGGFVYNTNNGYWCSAGGGGGAGEHSIYNGFTNGSIVVGSGGSGGAGANTGTSGGITGSSGGDTRVVSGGGVTLATAHGGYGGIGGYSQQVYGQPSAPGAQYGTNTPLIAGVGQFNDSGFWGGLSSCFALGGSGKAPTSAGILTGAYATGGSGGYGSSSGSPQYTSGGSGGSGYAQLSW